MMVFDWNKAASLIREARATNASAGLAGDWEFTGGPILEDGEPVDPEFTSLWLSSFWAEPQLMLEGELVECWLLAEDSPGWAEDTYWPDSARAILAGREAPHSLPDPAGT